MYKPNVSKLIIFSVEIRKKKKRKKKKTGWKITHDSQFDTQYLND